MHQYTIQVNRFSMKQIPHPTTVAAPTSHWKKEIDKQKENNKEQITPIICVSGVSKQCNSEQPSSRATQIPKKKERTYAGFVMSYGIDPNQNTKWCCQSDVNVVIMLRRPLLFRRSETLNGETE